MNKNVLIVLIIGIFIGLILGYTINSRLNTNYKIEGFVDGYNIIPPKTNMTNDYYVGYIAGSKLYMSDHKNNSVESIVYDKF